MISRISTASTPSAASAYAESPPRVAPLVPYSSESVRQSSGNTGHGVAICVRLCDGQHFPLERLTNATAIETCRTMCPASRTKVFYGSEVDNAVASDGTPTPFLNHNAIELHAATVRWEGEQLVVHDATQMITSTAGSLAKVFGLKPDQVRVLSPFVGGGFALGAVVYYAATLFLEAKGAVIRFPSRST